MPVAHFVLTEHLDTASAGEEEDSGRLAYKGARVEILVAAVNASDHWHSVALVTHLTVKAALES